MKNTTPTLWLVAYLLFGPVHNTQVLVYDLVIGKGLKCGGAWKALMMKHRSRLQAALARMKIKQKVSRNQDLLSSSLQHPEGYID